MKTFLLITAKFQLVITSIGPLAVAWLESVAKKTMSLGDADTVKELLTVNVMLTAAVLL